jgi:hypothetical protein
MGCRERTTVLRTTDIGDAEKAFIVSIKNLDGILQFHYIFV